MKFDLFKLNSKEDKPKGWIWVKFNSELLRKEYKKLLKKRQQNLIGKEISNNLNAGFSTVVKHLIKLKNSRHNLILPLPIIIEMIKLTNPNLKNKIIKNFKLFISKFDRSNQGITAVKKLDEKLASIIGAHMADGYLQKNNNEYRLKICDGREDIIRRYSEHIKYIFSKKAIVGYQVRFNNKYWICWFNSKIIGRYFEKIFDIPTGKKFDIAKEPELVKKSNFKIRKAFAKGVMDFDGGVKASGMVALTSMSKQLIDNIYEILSLDGISVNKKYNKKKKSWQIESRSGRKKEYLRKWLDYFEKGTWKYNRLKFFLDNKSYSIEQLEYLFPKHHRSKIQIRDVYRNIYNTKKSKIKDIVMGLRKDNLKVADTTIYKYLHLLEKSGLIRKEGVKITDGKYWWSETLYKLR
ncbi:hypothetical protein CL617_01515 [archaeon]|nr:hypothetical protein [archaeon]|tara:strand:- start:1364 stop:2587 length:1224 start_codon:yes stop_codon:yes gene_type:complete